MKTLFCILLLSVTLFFPHTASAVSYSCPSGGTVSGSSCVYTASCPQAGSWMATPGVCSFWNQGLICGAGIPTPYPPPGPAPTPYPMTTKAGGSAYIYDYVAPTNAMCVSGVYWGCPSGFPYMNSAFSSCSSGGSNICPANSVWVQTANGGSTPYGSCVPITGTPYCAAGYVKSANGTTCTKSATYTATCSISGSTLSGSTCSYAATPTYQCNPGDIMLPGNVCQPPTLYTTQTTHYSCADHDGNGAIDTLTGTTCTPNSLSYTGEPIWHCPAVAGDPDPIVAGAIAWSLNGSLQPTSGYTITGPLGAQITSSKKWIGGTTCSYQPPVTNGIFSFITHTCANPTYTPDVSGLFCVPPKVFMNSILNSSPKCQSNDVLNASTCTPLLKVVSATQITTYSCDPALPIGTTLDPVTHLCRLPLLTEPPTSTSTLVCGSSAKLNASTGMCDYVSIPAINVGGSYSCPALYTVGTGAELGWCIPTAQWAYPAAWALIKYTCPDGGTLGYKADGITPNGLCYMP